jgi:hypothetical protein
VFFNNEDLQQVTKLKETASTGPTDLAEPLFLLDGAKQQLGRLLNSL